MGQFYSDAYSGFTKTLLLIAVCLCCEGCLPSLAENQIPTSAPVKAVMAGRSGAIANSSVFRVKCLDEGISGTGFLHRSGKVITAAHVVDGCDESQIQIRSSAGLSTRIKKVVIDGGLDLALLTPKDKLPGPSLPISSTTKFVAGTPVSTWGYPSGYYGRTPLLMVGYLSGEGRVKSSTHGTSPLRWFVNAAFNSGNSGGPVLDLGDGSVIGVVSSKLAPIPEEIVGALEALKKHRGILQYTYTYPDGTTEKFSEGQVVAKILDYLRSQIQLVVGHAVKSADLRSFLDSSGVLP